MATFPEGCTLLFGGSGGIGSGVARTFAKEGSDIAVVYRTKAQTAQEAADYAVSLGRKGTTHACDVTDPAQVKAAVDAAIAAHGRIHSVVWGAGPLVNQRYMMETPVEEWRRAFEVEVHGLFSVAQAIVPHMREMGGGSFVHLGSAGHDWWPAMDGLSVAPKASNESLMKGIAKEEGKYNIRANSVLVGVIDAGMFRELSAQGVFDQAWIDETHKLIAIKRWGTPEEIAHACVYFTSNEGAYTTGQTISVSGGFGV